MVHFSLSDICWLACTMYEEIGERAFLREAPCFSLHGVTEVSTAA
jgi:hypothetical protein